MGGAGVTSRIQTTLNIYMTWHHGLHTGLLGGDCPLIFKSPLMKFAMARLCSALSWLKGWGYRCITSNNSNFRSALITIACLTTLYCPTIRLCVEEPVYSPVTSAAVWQSVDKGLEEVRLLCQSCSAVLTQILERTAPSNWRFLLQDVSARQVLTIFSTSFKSVVV